ncbi:VWA domain-containing protein [uncultured Paludibaculum sp.]|uniref:VWA domain-containing protein n=1 Tax=uncultured Paludibaculum sp. TaxID=1765020 RepID=UPI002AABEC06|nr:VWA domain-containing protein [uncultured Paludibaculum sp.]
MLLTCVGGEASSPARRSTGQQPPDSYRISVDVDLVVLQATVRDRKGGFAPDLREQDFAVYEDGAPQAIKLFRREDVPVTVGLVIDHSGSMMERLNHVIAAARTFVRASNQEDRMFVVNFNEKVSLGLPPTIPFTNRPDELELAILRAPVAGQTALYDALSLSLSRLQASDREKKALIVISDGGDNASVLRLAEVVNIAGQSNALVYTIGIYGEQDPDKNPGVLRQLARSTGGDAFFPQEMGEVVEICERIAREIRNQYTLGYISTNTEKNGTYRNIRVEARSKAYGKLSVRARTGYVARGAPKAAPQGDSK